MMKKRKLTLLGAAIDACAGTRGSKDTPALLEAELDKFNLHFEQILTYNSSGSDIPQLAIYFEKLAKLTCNIVKANAVPLILAGITHAPSAAGRVFLAQRIVIIIL
jgi:hypothetical protein